MAVGGGVFVGGGLVAVGGGRVLVGGGLVAVGGGLVFVGEVFGCVGWEPEGDVWVAVGGGLLDELSVGGFGGTTGSPDPESPPVFAGGGFEPEGWSGEVGFSGPPSVPGAGVSVSPASGFSVVA